MTLYELIADLRRGHPAPAASRTLDMVVKELGYTRDNLREACARLEGKTLPPGGHALLKELLDEAFRHGLDDLEMPVGPSASAVSERSDGDPGSVGILVIMAATAVVVLGLALAAVIGGIDQIMHAS